MSKKAGTLVIAVTGTPGAGKSTFSSKLAKETKLKIVEANDIVEQNQLFTEIDKNGSKIVKMEELAKELKAIIKSSALNGEKGIILTGHLLCDLKIDYDIGIVIRVGLKEMIKRLEARKYNEDKLKENITSESIDYCGVQILEMATETYEVETDADKSLVAAYIKERLDGKSPQKPQFKEINKLEEMLELVYEGNTYGL